MHFRLKNREYIILGTPKMNYDMQKLLGEEDAGSVRIVSNNTEVASCSKDGTVTGHAKGKATVRVYKDNECIKKVRVIVTSDPDDAHPATVNTFNVVNGEYKLEDLIKIEAGTPNWNGDWDIYAVRSVAEAYDRMCGDASKDDVFMYVTEGYGEDLTGMTLDVSGAGNSDIYGWLDDNSYKYGFIVNGKGTLAGRKVSYHITYVDDLRVATVLRQKRIKPEDYLNIAGDDSIEKLYHGSNLDTVRDEVISIAGLCEICGADVSTAVGISEAGLYDLNIRFDQIKLSWNKINQGDIFFCDRQMAEYMSEEKADRIAVQAYNDGAKLLFSKRRLFDEDGNEIPTVLTDDPEQALVKVGRYRRNQFSVKAVGVTGSCGKTTTKTLIDIVLKNNFNTHTNYANANDIQDVFQFITRLEDDHEFYVQEVSGAAPRRVDNSSEMLQLNASVITNIGNHHIDIYKTVENIAKDKLKIVENLAEGGVAFMNYDDDVSRNASFPDKNIVYISEQNEKADYYISSVDQTVQGLKVSLTDNYTSSVPKQYEITVDIVGRHNAFDIAAAFAVGQWAGIDGETIIEDLKQYHSQGYRQRLAEAGGTGLYLDCFSATEVSTVKGVESLVDLPCKGRRIAVIGASVHYGDEVENIFRRIGENIAVLPVDIVVCFGKDTKPLYDFLQEHGKMQLLFTRRLKRLMEFLRGVKENDLVLLKATWRAGVPLAVDAVFGTDFFVNDAFSRRRFGKRQKDGEFVYMVFKWHSEYMAVLDYYGGPEKEITVPDQIDGHPITHINKNAFKNKRIEGIVFGKNIVGAGDNAFKDCRNLSKVVLDPGLKYIGCCAFQGCVGLEEIELPEGLTHIGDHAFSDCKNLRSIYIPSSVKHIGEDILENCGKVKVKFEKDSYAESVLGD